jgi:hypothetical protein
MPSKIAAWVSAKRYRLSLSHCLTGLPIQFITACFFSLWAGAFAVLIFFYSRKVLAEQEKVKVKGQSRATVWSVGIFPWTWGKYELLDVALPYATSCLIAFLLDKQWQLITG